MLMMLCVWLRELSSTASFWTQTLVVVLVCGVCSCANDIQSTNRAFRRRQYHSHNKISSTTTPNRIIHIVACSLLFVRLKSRLTTWLIRRLLLILLKMMSAATAVVILSVIWLLTAYGLVLSRTIMMSLRPLFLLLTHFELMEQLPLLILLPHTGLLESCWILIFRCMLIYCWPPLGLFSLMSPRYESFRSSVLLSICHWWQSLRTLRHCRPRGHRPLNMMCDFTSVGLSHKKYHITHAVVVYAFVTEPWKPIEASFTPSIFLSARTNEVTQPLFLVWYNVFLALLFKLDLTWKESFTPFIDHISSHCWWA